MSISMNRGKHQVMYNYLPCYIFDFDKYSTISKVNKIRGNARNDLSLELILNAIKKESCSLE